MLTGLEGKFWRLLNAIWPSAHDVLWKKRLVLAFLVAGGTALVADVGVLYLCKGILGMDIIPAVVIAFLFGFCASFTLQKFWAFEDMSVDRVHAQASLYFLVAALNLFLNIIFMYLLVEVIHLWYILAKALVAGSIACGSFFVYKHLIFFRKP